MVSSIWTARIGCWKFPGLEVIEGPAGGGGRDERPQRARIAAESMSAGVKVADVARNARATTTLADLRTGASKSEKANLVAARGRGVASDLCGTELSMTARVHAPAVARRVRYIESSGATFVIRAGAGIR